MAKKATRIKTDTFAVRYQTRDEVEVAIKEIGDLNRELERLAIEQNDRLAAITEEYAPLMNAIKEKLAPKQDAVQAWCESRRDELTLNGKTKTGTFNTGEVQWRQRPPTRQCRWRRKTSFWACSPKKARPGKWRKPPRPNPNRA